MQLVSIRYHNVVDIYRKVDTQGELYILISISHKQRPLRKETWYAMYCTCNKCVCSACLTLSLFFFVIKLHIFYNNPTAQETC